MEMLLILAYGTDLPVKDTDYRQRFERELVVYSAPTKHINEIDKHIRLHLSQSWLALSSCF